jgi:hypothetical protein
METEVIVHSQLLTGMRGGFAAALGDAWCVADSSNRAKLEATWPNLFGERPKPEGEWIGLPGYRVDSVEVMKGAKVVCGGCDWEGTVEDVIEIDECILTAGDASPAGRCPECEALVYVEDHQT